MNNKKLFISILYVVLLSLLIAGAILFSKPSNKSNLVHNSQTAEHNIDSGIFAYKGDINRKEDIEIKNNLQKLDLHANLTEDMNGRVAMNLLYKLDGKHFNKTIDTSKIPEIRNIFRFREKYKKGYEIKNIRVNNQADKLYFYVKGRQDNNLTQTWLYTYDLKTGRVDNLFFDIGDFSDFYLSPDGKYNAFSYWNNPESTKEDGMNMVVIVRCEDGKLILNGNKDINGNLIGPDSGLYIYRYSFVRWQNNESCILKQVSEIKDGSGKIQEQNVHYNVIENKLHIP